MSFISFILWINHCGHLKAPPFSLASLVLRHRCFRNLVTQVLNWKFGRRSRQIERYRTMRLMAPQRLPADDSGACHMAPTDYSLRSGTSTEERLNSGTLQG